MYMYVHIYIYTHINTCSGSRQPRPQHPPLHTHSFTHSLTHTNRSRKLWPQITHSHSLARTYTQIQTHKHTHTEDSGNCRAGKKEKATTKHIHMCTIPPTVCTHRSSQQRRWNRENKTGRGGQKTRRNTSMYAPHSPLPAIEVDTCVRSLLPAQAVVFGAWSSLAS